MAVLALLRQVWQVTVARFVEYLVDGRLALARLEETVKGKLRLIDAKGRQTTLAEDKVLFFHDASSQDQLTSALDELAQQIDVELLWEVARSEDGADLSCKQLADLFFDEQSDRHASAIFRALSDEAIHFRRRGDRFAPRTADELEQMQRKQQNEAAAEAELAELVAGLRAPLHAELAARLERYVRGASDARLEQALLASSTHTQRRAFSLLVKAGHLPSNADFEVISADIRGHFPDAALQEAASATATPTATVEHAAFTIDDPDTREVDDAITITALGDAWQVDVDIADVALHVVPDGALDKEARRRATTVYLPTETFLMLPGEISTDRASLAENEPRAVVRNRILLDSQGQIKSHQIFRCWARVACRLSYDEADRLIEDQQLGPNEHAAALKQLATLCAAVREQRERRSALNIRRPEWKYKVSGDQVIVTPIEANSPSRSIVAELMILANSQAAIWADQHKVPLIYRIQAAPATPLPKIDPSDIAGFTRLRGMLAPAALSLNAGEHFGLGVAAYTQVTSPLRRYGDLVQQRQLIAAANGAALPYDAAALLSVLATVEATERQMKAVENSVNQRWALEYVAQQASPHAAPALIVAETGNGYRAQLLDCGAVGNLGARRKLSVGDQVEVTVERVDPRGQSMRLQLV
ncbi:MAG: RNB domain-containing ribonuclease [Deltaproteobacteria bacterium]|nr:RNB domain-containing ribonuclease [Deltaproteobacteria bacterium]